jgi:polyisoprenoid-binding protein YceI
MNKLNRSQALATDVYTIDPIHSSISFSVKHMMISHVIGHFEQFEGTIAFDQSDLADSAFTATLQVSSIDTRFKQRDDHLKSPDFFDAAKYPTITFASKTITGQKGEFRLVGDLTIKGKTKEISFPVVINGPVKNMQGSSVIGLSGQLTVNRQDYGMSFNMPLENGGVMVGNDVKVDINIEAQK